ncbi:potassium channel family protein [Vacuolonema iberomarrocanum]|uniref:potassium channel family protein n=1 Tax=Vacuolonema iberomarrocanum TaxID=3454632 RepID=UPI0019E89670|nr:NAD-binding protein [filamentous cyanobacterium LEGE 07170]
MPRNPVRWLVAILLINILAGIIIFRYGLGLDFLDATYFVITIVTTIGFGDFNLADAPTAIKIYGIYLMVSGAGGYALGFSLVVDSMIKSRLLELTGRKGYRMNDHVILCGFGKLGPKILDNLLQLGDEVLVIDRGDTEEHLANLRNRKIPYLLGDMRQQELLEKASLRSCKSIIFGTDDDLANLEAALMAREMAPTIRIVVRMYDQNLAERVEKSFDIQSVLSSSTVGAPFFAQAAHSEELIDITPIDEEIFLTCELKIEQGSPLDGMAIADLQRQIKLAVLVHQPAPKPLTSSHQNWVEYPNSNILLKAGDRITVSINSKQWKQLRILCL